MTDKKIRCGWAQSHELNRAYHDTEWGVPEWDSRALWEKLMLDGFQAGLSWLTILKKRDEFRRAFAGFKPERVARMGARDIQLLLRNPGIVRHRGKIESVIGNARAYLAMAEQGEDFAQFCWQAVDGAPQRNRWRRMSQVPAQTPMSESLSKALKAKGFRFCGPVIVYAFAQASGLVNDHLTTCFRYNQVAKVRKS